MINYLKIFSYLFLIFSQVDRFLYNFKFILYFLLNWTNYRIYEIISKDKQNIIFNKVLKYKYICNKYNENNEPIGLIVHRNIFPLFIIPVKPVVFYKEKYVTIICTQTFYNEINKEDKIKEEIILDNNCLPCKKNVICDKCIHYITKSGEYGYFNYGIRKVNLHDLSIHKTLHFYEKQHDLFKSIMNFYKLNHFCKVFLSGDPGSGKTFFAYMMSQQLDCYLCDVYKGNEPSSNFNEIYTRMTVSSDKPIILIFDEVDIMISEINEPGNQPHKKYIREIFDKTSWNIFMDKIEYGLFPYVIIMMNSNKRRSEIDKCDTSYLRDGRVNIIREWIE